MKIISRGFMGMGISYFITNIFMLFGVYGDSAELITKTYFTWMIVGMLFGVISIIYDSKRLSPMLQKTIHSMSCYVIFIIALVYLYTINWGIVIIASIFFLGIYIAIYLGFYIYEKKNIKKLNDKLSASNKH